MRNILLITLPLLALLVAVSGCDKWPEKRALAGQGHDHGHEQAAPAHGAHAHEDEGPDPVSVTMFTSNVLLFMEYPHLVKGEPAEFLAHFTVLKTGEPVRSGTFTLEAVGPGGNTETVRLDAPARAGIFIPEHAFGSAGIYAARLMVDSPQVQDSLELELVVHPSADAAFHAAEDAAGDEPPDSVSFLLEQQWKVGTLLGQAQQRSLTERLQLPGEITPQHHAEAAVTTPVSGRLLPPPSGKLPMVGDYVEAGEILAMIEPPLPATEAAALRANRAQLQALDTELVLRSLDLGVKGLEVERAFKQAEARLDFAKRAFGRAKEVKEKGVASDQQYDQAQQDLQLAQAEYDAALAMKQFYEESSARLADMQERLKSRGVLAEDVASLQMPLVAPISGHIVEHESVEGEHVEALEEIYEIVDLQNVWIVARISEFDLSQLPKTPNASLELPSYPDQRLDVLGMGGRLVNVGTRVDPQTRTVPIRFEIPNPEGLLRGGMFANVFLETRQARDALAVPESAIVMDNGRPLVYVMLEGETFQRREVELGIRDNGWVEVLAGVQEDEWVATRSAYAIKLASLSPASFGHGHGH
ncbi:MAG: efflux RND transporter periplasmic adaptor subunit [Phycisphaerales bacterium]|nr:MAG: efflux RND transporter periplasmic adaptor subunit [Phycisphaerales bacterium]